MTDSHAWFHFDRLWAGKKERTSVPEKRKGCKGCSIEYYMNTLCNVVPSYIRLKLHCGMCVAKAGRGISLEI